MTVSSNEIIAAKLREMADLLEAQEADGYRVAAYRRAAQTVATLDRTVDEIARREGAKGLIELEGIGRGIALAIMEIVSTGRWSQLDRISGSLDAVHLFQTLPGIGPELADRIHDTLHVDTLEQLEQTALDGRLEQVKGVGGRRAQAIKALLAERLGHRRFRSSRESAPPPVDLLLDVDREYLLKAGQGTLRKIAPKRFNPENETWLPVLHTRREPWDFTVLFSNTARAHELGRTRDWVVIYFHDDEAAEAQCTVVTETRGPLAGRRVVRGREGDCVNYYARHDERKSATTSPADAASGQHQSKARER